MARSTKIETGAPNHLLEAKVPEHLFDEVADFADRMEATSMSEAVRELLMMGLANSKDLEENFMVAARENATRRAKIRMGIVIRGLAAKATEIFMSDATFAEEEVEDEHAED